MRKCPAIGDRVQLIPSHRFGPLTGTVYAVYRKYADEWDEVTDEVTRGPLCPEPEWQIGFKADTVPANWSYSGTDRFAPLVSELRKL